MFSGEGVPSAVTINKDDDNDDNGNATSKRLLCFQP